MKHRGWKYDRISHNPREKIFAEEWERECQPSCMNYKMGILQDLFVKEEPRKLALVVKISPRDRMIVATVIQWLGSNVGMSFLQECLKKCGYEIRRCEL